MSKTPIHALKYIAELEAERDRLAGYIDRAEDSIFAAMAPSGWGRSTHEHHASRVTNLSNLYLGLVAENAPLRKALEPLQSVCGEIVRIMKDYREQAASPYGVDTPGGLEHMGDVWALLAKWEAALARIPEAGK